MALCSFLAFVRPAFTAGPVSSAEARSGAPRGFEGPTAASAVARRAGGWAAGSEEQSAGFGSSLGGAA